MNLLISFLHSFIEELISYSCFYKYIKRHFYFIISHKLYKKAYSNPYFGLKKIL